MGRLLRSTDPDNISTSYTYDMAGRMVQRVHPDAGTDRYHYDAAGNLTSHVNSMNDTIRYLYNFNQLTDVLFPRYPENNVHYEYGNASNANINAVGKVILQEDASGWQTFKYGKLGEVTENIRTFALPFESKPYTFRMKYEYDSWNRIQKMTYPDGEEVSYGYNRGGMLESVVGRKNGVSSDYINDIRYNKYELKDSVSYGNGSGVRYAYDSLLRLSRLQSTSADGVMQDIAYTYDSAGNILDIQNSAIRLPNGLGGAYQSTYTYDNLYRLTGAFGWWYAENMSYQLQMVYHPNGRIQRKYLGAPVYTQTTTSTSLNTVLYDNFYHYNANQPNTLSYINNVSEQQFEWDAMGNMTEHRKGNSYRYFCWDEQNRLLGVKDEGVHLSYYQYDANGDRIYKFTGEYTVQNQSGQWHYYYFVEHPTLYASPYLVSSERGYTKHYYAESERIASKIGGGGLVNIQECNVEDLEMFKSHSNRSYSLLNSMTDCLGAEIQAAENALAYLHEWKEVKEVERDCYWYHPDHLGSSSWITYTDGSAVQHLHYLPWGEDFVDQRTTDFTTRFTFSAKERDPETGLSYFGSRYYSSDLSIWLSVDPMAAKYPSLSPYVYCANNPVKLVDPNGEAFDTEIDETTQTITIHAVYYTTTKDAVQLKKELDAWKKKGESYSYISDGKGYSIRFNLEIKDFDDVNEAINKFTENKDDGISNYFQINKTVENPNHEKVNGINYEGNKMYVAKGQIRSIRHEIGHSLGLGDWNYGLMKSGGAIYGISKNNIISIFESAGIKSLIHNSLGDWNSRQTDPVCTSKTVHNKSGLFKRKHNQR